MAGYNLFLAMGSLVLFVAMASELIVLIYGFGFLSVFCDESGQWNDPLNNSSLYFFYHLNYIFKYVELLDTILLALRKKPIPFLHIYHHAATLILCWSQIQSRSCMQWVVIIINLGIHIWMYSYYALVALKPRAHFWWKPYLTQAQIAQFVISLIACLTAFVSRSFHDLLGLHQFPRCYGSNTGAWFGILVLASYLQLFIVLYRSQRYRQSLSNE
jgi:fatty acid elongase 3